jgi:hypothetical protein
MVEIIDKYGQVKRWNLIGFDFPPNSKMYKWQGDGEDGWSGRPVIRHCIYHPGTRLKQNKDYKLECPKCGFIYLENEAPNEEGIQFQHSNKQQPRIISAKSNKKKYYDKQGNLITDPSLIRLAKEGKNILYYNEQKAEEPVKPKKRRSWRFWR